MKLTLAALLPILTAACGAAPVSLPTPLATDFLYAIRQVESGDRYDCPAGPKGELGAYQFRSKVWYQHTSEPFSAARTRYADTVAGLHLDWIASSLRSAGVEPSTWNMAAAWNSGVGSVRSGRIPHSTRDYASRVENLVGSEIELRRSLTPRFPVLAPAGPSLRVASR